jgi:imidazolonepropionase-like amidohydrolase
MPADTRSLIPFRARVVHTVAQRVPPRPWEPADGAVPARVIDTPALSPDGTALLFTAAGMLWRQTLDGTRTPERIANGLITRVAWSPDGARVAVLEVYADEQADLRVFDSDLETSDRLTSGGLGHDVLAWSPDGTHLLVRRGGSIRSVDARDGTEQVLIASEYWVAPRLSADGSSIYATGSSGEVYRIPVKDPEAAVPITALEGQSYTGLVSADEEWLVFRRNAELYVARLPLALADDGVVTESEISLVAEDGGLVYAFTPDEDGLLFAVGSRLFRYDLPNGPREEIPVSLILNPAPRPALVIRNVRVIDHALGGFTAAQDIAIENGRIAQIGHVGALEDAVEVDAEGRYAIPGLWDAHQHGSLLGENARFLPIGMTSSRDAGSPITMVQAESERAVTLGEPIPRRFSSGEIFGGAPKWGGSGFVNQIMTEAEARRSVRLWKAMGARFIKVYRSVPWPLQRVIAEDARTQGLPVIGHGMAIEETIRSVTLGYQSVEHTPHPDRYWGDVLALLAATGTTWDPTMVERGVGGMLLRSAPERLHEGPLKGTSIWSPPHPTVLLLALWSASLDAIREAYEMRVPLLIGTDHQGDLHAEIEAFARAGIPPAEVLRMATLEAAAIVGADEHLGSLEVGKLADIVILDADPLEDITNTRSVWRVVLDGRLVER